MAEPTTAGHRGPARAEAPGPWEHAASAADSTRLARFAAAAQRLAMVLDVPAVLDAVDEILVNLAGVRRYAVYLRAAEDEWRPEPAPAAVGATARGEVPPDHPLVGRALAERAVVFADDGRPPLAVVPLVVGVAVLGVIVVERLQPGKPRLIEMDAALLRLLMHAAGQSLYAATVHGARGIPADFTRWLWRQLGGAA